MTPAPTALRTDHAVDPLHCGRLPRLSWQPGCAQTAWEIQASADEAHLADGTAERWRSGVVEDGACCDHAWGGTPLADSEAVCWRVRVRTQAGAWSAWSEPARLECGLIDWTGSRWRGFSGGWPGRVLLLRGSFHLSQDAQRVRLYVASPGGCRLTLNGTPLATGELDPGKTVFAKRVAYRVLAGDGLLNPGENILGAVLGTGWYGMPMMRAVLQVWHADGSCTRVTTGDGWQVGVGETLVSSPYDGEDADLRQHQPGWDRPEFNAGAIERTRRWFMAHVLDGPAGALAAQTVESEAVVAEEPLRELHVLPDGSRIYDAGRNLAGWARVRGTIPAGATLSLRFAEVLGADGAINQAPLYGARAEDRLTGNGQTCDWKPGFTYHGFRYVQADGPVEGLTLSAHEVRTDTVRRSTFDCDHSLLRRLHEAMLRTEAANQHAVFTDCPQRSERLGWLNDLTARAPQAFITYDVGRLTAKVCDDFADAQDTDGAIPDTVPYRIGHAPADPVCIAPLLLPLLQHRHFGRTSEVVRHLSTMRGWVRCLLGRADADGILHLSHYGDWSPPSGVASRLGTALNPACPGPFISTAFLAEDCRLLAHACSIAGLAEESAHWLREHQRIATAWRTRFVAAAGTVGLGSQSCLAVAIGLSLLMPAQMPAAVAALAADVRSRGHLTTGNIATRYVLEVLSDHGHHDLAFALVTRTAYPSWGYMLENGATTLWERWEGGAGGDMNSHSHPMLGSYQSWLYERLAGLMVAEDACGADRFTIVPRPAAGLTHCSASLDTPRGRAAIAWQVEGRSFTGDLQLPPGTSAAVRLPDGSRLDCTGGSHVLSCTLP